MSVCDGLPLNTMVADLYGSINCTILKWSIISIGTALGLNKELVDPSDDSKLVPEAIDSSY